MLLLLNLYDYESTWSEQEEECWQVVNHVSSACIKDTRHLLRSLAYIEWRAGDQCREDGSCDIKSWDGKATGQGVSKKNE